MKGILFQHISQVAIHHGFLVSENHKVIFLFTSTYEVESEANESFQI